MLSVIIATEGAEHPVVATLAALVPGAAAGVIKEVILVDHVGSTDMARVADVAGCRLLRREGQRAAALDAGARDARAAWLMFLHPGAVLDPDWINETTRFIQNVELTGRPRAGLFRYARSPYADDSPSDKLKYLMRKLRGPSPEQGLLIARSHYLALGGYSDTANAESRLLRRLGKSRLILSSRITTAG